MIRCLQIMPQKLRSLFLRLSDLPNAPNTRNAQGMIDKTLLFDIELKNLL